MNVFSYFFGAKHFVLTEYGHTFLQAYWDRRAQDNILSSEEDLQKKLTKYEITKVEYNSFRMVLPLLSHLPMM